MVSEILDALIVVYYKLREDLNTYTFRLTAFKYEFAWFFDSRAFNDLPSFQSEVIDKIKPFFKDPMKLQYFYGVIWYTCPEAIKDEVESIL